MKTLIFATASIAAVAVLAGCAAPGPEYYGNQAYRQPADPNGWQVVSVRPVPAGTGARAASSGDSGVTTSATTTYSSAPTYVQQAPVYAPQPVYGAPAYGAYPVYGPQPVYVPPPVYTPRYYYPPVSIGLGFNFGRGWGHHRGWGGSVGTRFPYHHRR